MLRRVYEGLGVSELSRFYCEIFLNGIVAEPVDLDRRRPDGDPRERFFVKRREQLRAGQCRDAFHAFQTLAVARLARWAGRS